MPGREVSARHDSFGSSWAAGLLCSLVMVGCVLAAGPFAEIGIMDDWSYIKTAQIFAQTGHFVYNGWATAMLGWQIWWGGLFIKLFGFSFNATRLSTLPLALVTILIFHQILVRCGIRSPNAAFGALTLGLSPLFLVLTASYMTDIQGLLCVVLCLYLCLRAVGAESDRAAVLWLAAAAVTNVFGGTVRQIAWLGVLVMVPCTAWLLRRRRGALAAGFLLWLAGVAGILGFLHWFNQQPYSVPEHLSPAVFDKRVIVHFMTQVVKTPLCLLLVSFPLLAAWLPGLVRWPRRRQLALGAILAAGLLPWLLLPRDYGDTWLAPWLHGMITAMGISPQGESQLLGVKPVVPDLWIRVVLSVLVLAAGAAATVDVWGRVRGLLGKKSDGGKKNEAQTIAESAAPGTEGAGTEGPGGISWTQLLWLTGPFVLAYIALLVHRGFIMYIYDRYLPELMAVVILLLLRYYQEFLSPRLPGLCWWVLALFTVFSVAGLHDIFALARARVQAGEELTRAGIPRTAIGGGFEYDGWTQIEAEGTVHSVWIRNPPGASTPRQDDLALPPDCTYWFYELTPSIQPRYYVVFSPVACFAGTEFAPVSYGAWLPPFHRELYIQRRK